MTGIAQHLVVCSGDDVMQDKDRNVKLRSKAPIKESKKTSFGKALRDNSN